MIPIMEQEYVDKNHWLDREEFMDIMVVAQTTPGIFSIDMASHIGYKLRGVWGGIVGALGIALPSIIAILLIAIFFHNFKDNVYVEKFFRGVRPAVVALIALVFIDPLLALVGTPDVLWEQIQEEIHSAGYDKVFLALLRGAPALPEAIGKLQNLRYDGEVTIVPIMVGAGYSVRSTLEVSTNPFLMRLRTAGFPVKTIIKGVGEYPEFREVFYEKLDKIMNED